MQVYFHEVMLLITVICAPSFDLYIDWISGFSYLGLKQLPLVDIIEAFA